MVAPEVPGSPTAGRRPGPCTWPCETTALNRIAAAVRREARVAGVDARAPSGCGARPAPATASRGRRRGRRCARRPASDCRRARTAGSPQPLVVIRPRRRRDQVRVAAVDAGRRAARDRCGGRVLPRCRRSRCRRATRPATAATGRGGRPAAAAAGRRRPPPRRCGGGRRRARRLVNTTLSGPPRPTGRARDRARRSRSSARPTRSITVSPQQGSEKTVTRIRPPPMLSDARAVRAAGQHQHGRGHGHRRRSSERLSATCLSGSCVPLRPAVNSPSGLGSSPWLTRSPPPRSTTGRATRS